MKRFLALVAVLVGFLALGSEASAQSAPTGQRYWLCYSQVSNSTTCNASGAVDIGVDTSPVYPSYEVVPWTVPDSGYRSAWSTILTSNYRSGVLTPGRYASSLLPGIFRHNTCAYMGLYTYTDIISCYKGVNYTIPYDKAKHLSYNTSDIITSDIEMTAIDPIISNGVLYIRFISTFYAAPELGTHSPINLPVRNSGTLRSITLQYYMGQIRTTTLPIPLDPNSDENKCYRDDNKVPHGVVAFVPDDMTIGTWFRFKTPPYASGWNGYDPECVYVLGRDPTYDYINDSFSTPVEKWMDAYFDNDFNNGDASGNDGCIPKLDIFKHTILKIAGRLNFNVRTCMFYGTGYFRDIPQEVKVIDIEIIAGQELIADKNTIQAEGVPGSPLNETVNLSTAPAEALNDLMEAGGSPRAATPEQLGVVTGNATVRKEENPCTLQSYYHPGNYDSAGNCLKAFDRDWGPTPYADEKAWKWSHEPILTSDTKENLTVIDKTTRKPLSAWLAEKDYDRYNMTISYPLDKFDPRLGTGTPPPGGGIKGGETGGTAPDPIDGDTDGDGDVDGDDDADGDGDPDGPPGQIGEGGFYESKYPDGFDGVWATLQDGIEQTPFVKSFDEIVPEVAKTDGALCYEIARVNLAGPMLQEDLCLQDSWLDIIATVLVLLSALFAIKIVTGW